MDLQFAVPGDSGSDITGYDVSLDDGTTWAALDATSADTTVTATVSGLAPGRVYQLRVRAGVRAAARER